MLFRLARILMAAEGDPSGGGGGAAPAPTATAAPEGSATAPPAQTDPVAALLAEFKGLKAEIVDMRRENRKGAPAAPPVPTPQGTPTWTAETTLAFRDGLDEAGLSLSVERRRVLEKLARAEGISADFGAWAATQAAALGWKKPAEPVTPPAATPTPPAAAPAAPVNPGPPAGTSSGATVLPDDFSQIPQSVVDAMTPAEAAAHFRKVIGKQQTGHPFARHREAEKQTPTSPAAIAAAVAEAMARARK